MTNPFVAARFELVVFSAGGELQRYRLPAVGQVRIGRDTQTNHIKILDASVSANHAILTIGATLSLQDLGTTNGTILRKGDKDMDITQTEQDRRYMGESFHVDPGDRLLFGSVMAVVRSVHLPSNAQAGDGGTWPHPPVVRHPEMQMLYSDARRFAYSSSRACILLLGETGVGKDVLARSIHAASPRASGPFIAVNCPSIVETMFEREMFGHKRGTFTDAKVDAKGYFEAADGGTLFLDEIGELALGMQAKLLRVLDDRRITRVGETDARLVNVRVIAATNQNLQECVARGTFRRDLYYRLRGFELKIPPLRSRPADIVPLAEAFIEDECRAMDQQICPRLSPEAITTLEAYDFPGNVRELRHAMLHAVAHCREGLIYPEHLPEEVREPEKMERISSPEPVSLREHGSERERILRALHASGGNHVRAALMLGISKRTLYNRLNRYPEIPRPRKQ
jgi:two-component system, NtrC family, response regulator AtoC